MSEECFTNCQNMVFHTIKFPINRQVDPP